jgi:negative regulator of flagellin synthesis FlgM
MKIGNSNPLNTPAAALAAVNPTAPPVRQEAAPRDATPPAPTSGTPADAPDSSTNVQMSETSAALREGGMADANAEFDTEKVQRMRQAISDGVYRINAEAIADKLLANAQDLLGQIGTGR